jgi:hypothetical protein
LSQPFANLILIIIFCVCDVADSFKVDAIFQQPQNTKERIQSS